MLFDTPHKDPSGDPQYRLDRYLAKIEAFELKNIQAGRSIWRSFMLDEKGLPVQTSASLWQAFADFERFFFKNFYITNNL
jgi:hypothetical protein